MVSWWPLWDCLCPQALLRPRGLFYSNFLGNPCSSSTCRWGSYFKADPLLSGSIHVLSFSIWAILRWVLGTLAIISIWYHTRREPQGYSFFMVEKGGENNNPIPLFQVWQWRWRLLVCEIHFFFLCSMFFFPLTETIQGKLWEDKGQEYELLWDP